MRCIYADLSRLSEMKRVAGEIAGAEPEIDVLINNAGALFNRDGSPKTVSRRPSRSTTCRISW